LVLRRDEHVEEAGARHDTVPDVSGNKRMDRLQQRSKCSVASARIDGGRLAVCGKQHRKGLHGDGRFIGWQLRNRGRVDAGDVPIERYKL
jgi:hypothetical protein